MRFSQSKNAAVAKYRIQLYMCASGGSDVGFNWTHSARRRRRQTDHLPPAVFAYDVFIMNYNYYYYYLNVTAR